MITNPTQFPTTSTISSGIGDTDYDTEMTDIITTLTCTEDDFCKGYYLFSIPWEYVPDIYKSSQYFSDPASFGVRPYTEPQNVGGFYMGWRRSSSPAALALLINSDYAIANNRIVLTPITMLDYRPSLRFYNNFNIRKSANLFVQGRETTISAIRVDENGIVYRSYQTPDSASPSINNENFVAFLQGSISFDLTFTSWSKMSGGSSITDTLTLTLSKNDLENENQCKVIEQNGNTYYIGIVQYVIQSTRDNNMSGSVTDYTNHFTALVMHENNHKHLRVCQTGKLRSSDEVTWYEGYARILYDGSNYSGNGTGDFTNAALPNIPNVIGTLDITVSKSDFINRANGYFWKNTYTWAYRQDSNTLRIFRFYAPSEVIKHMMLSTRFCTTTYDGASIAWNATQRVPKFDTNDIALDEWLIGSYYDYAADLRPWQDTFLKANDYTEQDIPPYVPPTPTDEEQTDGIDWLPNRSFAVDSIDGFVTMYGLRGDQIGRFGQYLWAEFWSEDFLNSIGVIFNQNLSINPSEILNYIVSVRCYPFSLSGRAGASSIADTIYLGRGGEGISLNSGNNILKLTSYTEDIDGGLSVWEGGNTIPAYYNDFRDYEPCSKITVFVPFCGSLELPPSQVVGNRIHLRYAIDFSSGALQATISVEGRNNYIAGILTGTIGATVELSASNLGQVIQKIGGLAVNAAKSAALLSIGATEANAAMAYDDAGIDALLAETSSKGVLTQGVISTAETITSVGDMSTGSPASFGTTAGFSSFQVTTPIIRVEYRHYEVPSNYAHVYGYACNKTVTLSDLEGKGYTVCSNVDLSGIPATQEELSAIESLLTSGVYF